MDTNKMREDFEAAISEETGVSLTAIQLSRKDDSYSTSPLFYAWWAWQASRAAVVVELPDSFGAMTHPCADKDEVMDPQEVRSAIEAQGLKVKP